MADTAPGGIGFSEKMVEVLLAFLKTTTDLAQNSITGIEITPRKRDPSQKTTINASLVVVADNNNVQN